jgi:hypothetical protein
MTVEYRMITAKASLSVNVTATRAPPSERDATLSTIARSWAEQFHAPLRPDRLCQVYPRVANRLALCWPDSILTERLFDELLIDKRGGRRGFPAEIAAELVRLRRFSAKRLPPRQLELLRPGYSQDERWALHLQSPSDR